MKAIKDEKLLKKKIRYALLADMSYQDIRTRFGISILYHTQLKSSEQNDYIGKVHKKIVAKQAHIKNNDYLHKLQTSKQEPYHTNEMMYGSELDLSHITWDSLSDREKEFYNEYNKSKG